MKASDDGTPNLLNGYPNTTVYHLDERNGKIGAMNRGMEFVKTPIVIFSDANTNLGKESVRRIFNLFSNATVRCVSGEKRIVNKESDVASGAGEGIFGNMNRH
nr:glycosyltransferase [Flavobacterium sp. LM4]